jgi:alkyl sulfatase BDS1-like metallo-beta-lactamase superfamily hydrolase
MIFQNTPNTEAPREMNTYIPDLKALWMAENVTATFHNIYTLRGAPVRDPLNWSRYINEALWLFGQEAEVMFASHHWPRWGNERIREILRDQRDLYANMNNQVLHYANQGVTINQIHNVYRTPASLEQKWHCRGYHGSPEHNARGVIQRYLGFWDCNPATLIPLSPEDSAPLYVEMMGGSGAILARARGLHDAGDYKLAVEILNKLVLAEPANPDAKNALADAFEQLGYQQENPGLRNSFLAAAYELRSGIPQGAIASSSSPDVIRAMSTELFLNFLAIKMDSRRAEGLSFVMNLVTPDNGERFVVELSNATLTNIQGYQAENADLTLTVNRADLEQVMGGQTTLEALLGSGAATAEGDVAILGQLAGLMVEFDPRFEIMPGTQALTEAAAGEALEAEIGALIPE